MMTYQTMRMTSMQLAGPISRLVEMGFSPEAARTALINNNGDENLAVNELLASV